MTALKPPLRGVWFAAQPTQRVPVTVGKNVVLSGPKYVTYALERGSWSVAWARADVAAMGVYGSDILSCDWPRGVGLLESSTGKTKRRHLWGKVFGEDQVVGDLLLWGYLEGVHVGNLSTGDLRWSIELPSGSAACGTGTFIGSERYVVFGMRGGDVVAVDIKTGREKWRTSVADLSWQVLKDDVRVGEATGKMHIYGETVIVNVSNNHLACLALSNGRRIWAREMRVSETIAIDDRICVANNSVVDARSGRMISQKWQGMPAELERRGILFTGGFALSDTHGYSCTNNGDVAAWERSTGKVVWWHRPPGACGGFGVKLLIADGRLYWADGSKRLYCLEEVEPTDPVLKADRAALETAGTPFRFPRVPFEIREPRAASNAKLKRKS